MPLKSIRRRVFASISRRLGHHILPAAAKGERRRDHAGLPSHDPGTAAVIDASTDWLCSAQEHSRTADGGVARAYSLVDHWESSYPETTGYIVSTILARADEQGSLGLKGRAQRMLDWLASIQLESGAFQGGMVDSTPIVPVTFNTGQILLGLASGESAFGTYGASLQRAADWLVSTQDRDGCWRRFPTPFAIPGLKTYETHVSWALLEAARLYPNRGYAEAALRNIRWAIGNQRDNGWLEYCCLTDNARPLTHTLGYALRGFLEGYRYSSDADLRTAARRTADGLLSALGPDGLLPGRLASDWSAAVPWACLTGTVQIAYCWLLLYEDGGDTRYLTAARRANAFVRRTVRVDGAPGIRGGVKGSFPVDGGYGSYEYLSWAAKFLVDSLMLERKLGSRPSAPA
jgi:hypothetical protein